MAVAREEGDELIAKCYKHENFTQIQNNFRTVGNYENIWANPTNFLIAKRMAKRMMLKKLLELLSSQKLTKSSISTKFAFGKLLLHHKT